MQRRCENEAARLLEAAGVPSTPKRRHVLGLILAKGRSVSPPELLDDLSEVASLNKVTLYRILDLLVEHNLLQRSSLAGRACRYCLRDSSGRGHSHFQCRQCGAVHCLSPEDLPVDEERLAELPMHVEEVELRLIGLCLDCRNEK